MQLIYLGINSVANVSNYKHVKFCIEFKLFKPYIFFNQILQFFKYLFSIFTLLFLEIAELIKVK